jgi:UDP-N-acetylmuramate dehydrogenase
MWLHSGGILAIEAGARLGSAVDFTIAHGYTGFQKMAGIPGSVGGAIIGNAGAYGQAISSSLIDVQLLEPTGAVATQSADELVFAYRTSRLKASPDIVLSARFQLKRGDARALRHQADEIISVRESKLPSLHECAGSYFKNIEDASQPYGKLPAGKLLEQVGAKGMRVGNAAVSRKHANVIVNLGGACARDVLELASRMKRAVRDKYGFELEEEVRFLGRK